MINIIAIVARDGAIGLRGDQPFHISDDFRRFRALTLGHPIIMGRKTFEALPKGALPGRRNIVVTRSASWSAPSVETAPSVAAAIEMASATDPEVMIIGGGEIYRQAMPLATRLYLTEVDARVPEADTFFPDVEPTEWALTDRSTPATDPHSGATYTFATYTRQN